MEKPIELRVLRHNWNDGCHGWTSILALFDTIQAEVPTGWELTTRYEYIDPMDKVGYIKYFPYGTTVRNGHIVV